MMMDNINRKYNYILLIYAIVYTIITIYFIFDMTRDESSSLAYVLIFPEFWIISGLILGLLFWLIKIKLQTTIDIISFTFCTPLPFFVFYFIMFLLSSVKH